MAVPQILNVSSNIGASRIATILGPKIEQAWYQQAGVFQAAERAVAGAAAAAIPVR